MTDKYPIASLRNARSLIRDIQEALDTEENGKALVEVARNAHRAEQELAAIKKLKPTGNYDLRVSPK